MNANDMAIHKVKESMMLDKSRKAKLHFEHQQRIVKTKIRLNQCPICSSKLQRGKRDKTKNYKREFTCTQCSGAFHI